MSRNQLRLKECIFYGIGACRVTARCSIIVVIMSAIAATTFNIILNAADIGDPAATLDCILFQAELLKLNDGTG